MLCLKIYFSLGKFLQIMTTYYIHHKEDPNSVEYYIADFNKTFDEICAVFKDVTGEDIRKGANAKAIQKSCEALKKKIAEKEKPEGYFQFCI